MVWVCQLSACEQVRLHKTQQDVTPAIHSLFQRSVSERQNSELVLLLKPLSEIMERHSMVLHSSNLFMQNIKNQ